MTRSAAPCNPSRFSAAALRQPMRPLLLPAMSAKPLREPLAQASMARGYGMIRNLIATSTPRARGLMQNIAALALLAVALLVLGPQPARADRCDDLAAQLKSQIDGLTVGRTAANVIYLGHPAAKQARLGCVSRNVTNELSAASDSRKPSPAFLNFVATASAITFTIPKPDTLAGVTRCVKRMGFLHGDDVKIRYRRLDMQCTRTKTSSAITISRGKDE
jgi:hypothetical protein